jgi:gliding motility-associated-like protein
MKRILYCCLVLLSLCFYSELNAQTPTFSITQNPLCYNTSGSYQSTAAIVAPNPAADSYSWTVVTGSPGCTPSFTPFGTTAVPPQTSVSIAIDIPCCGNYTVVCFAMLNGLPIATVPQNTLFSGGFSVGVIYCPNGASVTPSATNICIGSTTSLTAAAPGATAWAWSSGQTTSVIAVSPTVNTCYSFTATTAAGCTITSSAPGCVSVQAITATVSPASQSMCAGSPVSFTANATVVSNSSVTPGTTITGYQWYDPTSTAIGSAATATAFATGGNYTVVVTHTGVAGTCTLEALSAVVITTNIPVTLTPSSFSICPAPGCVTLTAASIQTAAANYTWTESGTVGTFTGNPVVRCNGPRSYTVDVDYFGCPGTASVTIGLLTLTPTLTSSALTSCPSRSLTLTASGAINYTFSATPAVGTPTANLGSNTTGTFVHTPTGLSLPMQYCVLTESTGCTGTTCIVVNTRTLTPTLTASSPSVCNGSTFTLTASGSGVYAGASYTFSAGYNANIGIANPVIHTPPTGTLFPRTYSVTVDSAGCRGVGFVTVDSLVLHPILSSASPSICLGTSLTLVSTGGAGTQFTFFASEPKFDLGATSTSISTLGNNFTAHTPTPIYNPTTTVFNYTVVVDSAGCKGIGTYSIGILDLGPTLSLTTLPASGSVCPGSTVTIQALGSINYSFTSPPSTQFYTVTSAGGSDTVFATANVPFNIPPSGVVYTVQADSAGCVGSKTLVVREFKLAPDIILTPTLVCSGQPVTLTSTLVSSGTYSFYSATTAAPVPSLILSSTSFSTTHNPTIQTVYWVVVDSSGCTSIIPPPTKTITLRPDLPLLPSTAAASVCPGISTTLSVVAPTTALNYTYTWSQVTGTGQIAPPLNSQSVVAYPTSNSSYSVHVLDSLGCVGNTVISVGIDPGISFPILLASSGSTICQITGQAPQSVTLSASSTVTPLSLGTINYTWTPITGLSPSNTGTSVISSPTVSTLYTVIGDNGYGCVGQNTISVHVGVVPVPTITPLYTSVCPGFTSTLTAFGANSYTWTGSPASFTAPIAQQSISVGPGTYAVLASNGGGCTNTAVQTITIAPPLNIYVTSSSPTTCISSNSPKFSKPVQLSATGAGSYVWFPYNPIHMTYSLGPTTNVRPPVTTVYTVVGTSPICSGYTVITVNVIDQFGMNVTPPLPAMCLGDSLVLSVTGIDFTKAVGPLSAMTYSWTEALNAPPISITSYFSPTVAVYPQNTTTYTTEVRDSRQCISFPKLVTVTVLPRPITAIAIPTINSVATNTVCFVGLNPGALDVTIDLTGNNMNTGLQFGVVPTYTWISPYSPTHVSILTPVNNNAITVNAPIKLLDSSAVAIYTLISGYNGVQGCKRIDTVSVRVVDCRPVRTITFTTVEKVDTICARNCITYINQTDTMAGGPQTYTWTFKGGSPSISNAQNPTVCYNFPGAYDVILQVANPYPLITTSGEAPGSAFAIGTLKYIKVVDIPNVTIVSPGQVRSDTTVRFGQTVNLNASGARSYEWSPSYNISSLSKANVTVSPFKTTQYILTGYNSKGCLSSDTINVIVVEDCGEMYVPNAFTPNNDGNNDVLYVRGICLQSLTFMIFDRWGEKIFETADQSRGWDGTYKGQALNSGVFVYRLEGKTYDNKAFSRKGNITLLR